MSVSITSAVFQKKFGRFREMAASNPVFITLYGRKKLVFMSIEHYEELLAGANPVEVTDATPEETDPDRQENEQEAADVPASDIGEMLSLMAGQRG